MLLIGIDCATDEAKVGLARASLDSTGVAVNDVLVCGKETSAAETVAAWVQASKGKVILAMDAPLGWPAALGTTLVSHRAGDEVVVAPNELFRRTTDRFIQQRLKKTPLDVGADRIARTAHAALRMLGEIRRRSGHPIPLAWSPRAIDDVAAIEVYPAATLISRRIRSDGYKKPTNVEERREIIRGLQPEVTLLTDSLPLEQNADALDAAVCVLAAADFLWGRAAAPVEQQAVKSEGWIWTRLPSATVRGEA